MPIWGAIAGAVAKGLVRKGARYVIKHTKRNVKPKRVHMKDRAPKQPKKPVRGWKEAAGAGAAGAAMGGGATYMMRKKEKKK